MINEISSAVKSDHGKAVLYAGALGLLFSDIIPTPADAIYFEVEKKLRDKWKAGQITPQRYWAYTTAAYYGLNPLWWALVLGVVVYSKGSVTQKAKIGIGIIGAGAVAAVIYKNINQDIKANIA